MIKIARIINLSFSLCYCVVFAAAKAKADARWKQLPQQQLFRDFFFLRGANLPPLFADLFYLFVHSGERRFVKFFQHTLGDSWRH
jgi:hypothetical protein